MKYRVVEIMVIYKVSRMTVLSWIKKGLKTEKVYHGMKWHHMITIEDIEEFMSKSRETEARSEDNGMV